MNVRKLLTLFAVMLLALAVVACGGGTATEAPVEEMEEDASLSGDVVVDGSSTVYPVTTAVAEEFATEYSDVNISVGLSGTGGGFSKFCPGETDIQDASRPIKDSEADLCDENGVEWTEFLVALDGLTVMVNPANDWVDQLTQDQLAQLFADDSDVTLWSDLDPSYPDEEILFFIPDPDSGTRDYMTEVVVEEIQGRDAGDLRQDENTTFSSDDNVLLDGIANEQYAIGFFGYAYYANNQDAVKAVAIENDAGDFVLPSDETVQGGTYNPLSRPLFIYTNNESVRVKPQVAEFVRYYFAEGAELVMPDVGYSLPPAGAYDVNLQIIDRILMGQNPVGTRAEMGTGVTEEPAGTPAEGETLSGDVVVDGSSTVYPVTTAVAEEFSAIHDDVNISVGLSGTGGGFEKFCPGETDIQDASRPIKDGEADLCEENGVEWTEFLVALDGLTVMVNPENEWVDQLTQEQLGALFEANSTIITWADLNPEWPAEEILFFIPDPDSGTRDYMTEVVEDITGAEDLRQDENTTFSSDDNVLLDGIANEQYAVGFFGYAYYASNQDAVKAVAIENDEGDFVLPSDETVQNGTYNPLSRPLFIYVNNDSLREKEQVAEFVRYYFQAGAELVMSDVGYSLPPADIYDDNLAKLDAVLAE